MNKIVVTGRIISRHEAKDGSLIITIASKNGKDTYPKFVCHGIDVPSEPRVRVKIIGHVVCDGGGRVGKNQHFEADSVVKDESLLEKEFGVKGKFFAAPDTKVWLIGRLSSIKDDGEWDRYRIRLAGAEGDIICSRKRTDRPPKITIGEPVCAFCGIATAKKSIKEKDVFFENLIVNDIAEYTV